MIRKLLPHAAIILSAMYFVFFFIDRVNSAMAFIDNDITKALLFALCVICVIESVLLIRDDRRRTRRIIQRTEQRNAYSTRRQTRR